jgi:hypothetical protein
MPGYQEREFLTLMDSNKENDFKRKMLRSPLGLSHEIVRKLFEERFDELNDELDNIKGFAAGITRAKKLSNSSSVANMYPDFFAFHQFVQSSFRARQGKVLEEIMKTIISDFCHCDFVPEKPKEMKILLKRLFGKEPPTQDIDALGYDSTREKLIIVQIRSRDDTGGTTAKGSLVDYARELLREKNGINIDIFYLICVWDDSSAQQKPALISKCYSSIKDYTKIPQNRFESEITSGVELRKNFTLQLCYGIEEILQTLNTWSENKDEMIMKSIQSVIYKIENWDELWVSYSLANLELEVIHLNNVSNITILKGLMDKTGKKINFKNYDTIVSSVEEITSAVIPLWKDDSLPVHSVAEKSHYIRDLLFLFAIYKKINL